MQKVKIFSLLVLLSFISYRCGDNRNHIVKDSQINTNLDTLYSDEVLREYAGQFKDYKSILKFEYLDRENNSIVGLNSNDSINFRIIYLSQKFPILNENYEIHLYPVSENFTSKRLNRNKFQFFIQLGEDMIEFDLALSCKSIVFKYGELDKENNLTYVAHKQVFLGRFYEPVGRIQ